jgi:hypothetical protein
MNVGGRETENQEWRKLRSFASRPGARTKTILHRCSSGARWHRTLAIRCIALSKGAACGRRTCRSTLARRSEGVGGAPGKGRSSRAPCGHRCSWSQASQLTKSLATSSNASAASRRLRFRSHDQDTRRSVDGRVTCAWAAEPRHHRPVDWSSRYRSHPR